MNINGSTVLVLGGWGLVGSAVCRKLMEFNPARIIVTSLKQHEAEEAVKELFSLYPDSPTDRFIPWWGNVFTRTLWKDLPREDILKDSEKRRILVDDCIDELNTEILHTSALYDVLITYKPDAVIDCINTATAIAYQDIYAGARKILKETDDNQHASSETVERLVASLYVPQLTRHIQILYKGLIDAKTTVYLKVGTSGTGGMGLNIPYTHSEEQPSRVLLAKAAVAGAQTLLLFLTARTPNGPIVKEIKPSATIAWKRIGYGQVMRKGKLIPLEDMLPKDAKEASGEFSFNDTQHIIDTGDHVKSVFIDTGENGIFSRAEFQTISALGQMEIVTPEEIADTVVFELRGGNTGLDVINALDASVMGPTYRGGIMRNDAMSQLNALEKQYDVHSVAFEMLGPPRLSKLLFEANLLKRIAHSLESVSSMTAVELSKKAETLIIENQSLRSEMLSVGLVILMSDGEKYLRGSDVKIPAFRGENSLEINTHSINQWCYEGWIDLRPSNFEQWQERIIRIKKEVQSIAIDDTSSRHYYGKHYWADFNEIDEGKLAAWIFEREDKGWRFKR
ncbi:MAG: short-chain dehydrogenase [Bacteroidota bacterium]